MAFNALFVDREVADNPEAALTIQRIAAKLGLFPEIVYRPTEVYDRVSAAKDPVARGKEVLYLTRNRGAFIRNCPGTRHYICCDYRILHIGAFCTMDCAYCILQSYFHPPVTQFFLNHDEMFAELSEALEEKTFRRIGTGEFTDSLIWELWTDLVPELVWRFAEQDHAVLELKSKTTAVDRLLDLRHNRKTVLSWSLNTEAVIRENERGTASLSGRLDAAARCEARGYPLAFHFDPMVVYDGCAADYKGVIDRLFARVSPENIVWISLGTFRFMSSLKPIVQSRFPDSKIVYGEFISGVDDKMRYFKPIRIELYRAVIDHIRGIAPEVPVYFCMEDADVWRRSSGSTPEEDGALGTMLDESARRVCGLS